MKQIKLTMHRKDGREVVAYFNNVSELVGFSEFLKEYTDAVIAETLKKEDK